MEEENKFLEMDALQTLIDAVRNYLDELGENYNFLVEAANVCQMAMGSDAIAQIQINKMYDALEGLRVTALTAQEVAEDLRRDLLEAQRISDM